MKKHNLKDNKQREKTTKAVCYLRVGSLDQLSLGAQKKYLNSELEYTQKGE